MKKTYGVCFGMLAMGFAIGGAPASKAQNRMAADGTGGGSESSTAIASASPAMSSPTDLDRRIEALETELSELRTELAAKRDAEPVSTVVATSAVAAQDKPVEKTTIAGLLGPTSVSGFVDVYYQVNFNHPNQATPNFYPGADFRVYDFRSQSISLNMAELILDKAPAADSAIGRTGYHVSVGFGDGMNVTNSFDPAGLGFAQYLKEGYVSYLAPLGKGLQVDFGKFVTPMGAEVIESKDNWNYSRSILFGYAIPFYHFGVRAKYAFNDKYSLTGFVTNGWNNVVDNNSGKTYGFSFAGTPTKQWSYYVNYLAGPETPAGTFGFTTAAHTVPATVNSVWRQTWDATLMYTPTSRWSFTLNYDYGRGDRTVTNFATNPNTLSPPVYWTGFAGYVKYSPDANDYFAGRYEYYNDHDGFTTTSSIPGIFGSGGPASFIPSTSFNASGNLKKPHYNEFTLTYQRTLASYLLARFEYRRDSSQFPVYAISTFGPGVKSQNTFTMGLILLFDSRNAK